MLLLLLSAACSRSNAAAAEPEGAAAASAGLVATVVPASALAPAAPPAPATPPVVEARVVEDSYASTCATVDGQLVCSITYDPTDLDLEIEPVTASGSGLGVHYACFPGDPLRWNGQLLIHFVGTIDNPGRTHGFAERACALGFAAVAPMYKNGNSSRSVCRSNSSCYEGLRREILYGGDSAPDPIRVDATNSALHRLDTLLRQLAMTEPRFPAWATVRDRLTVRDFTEVVVSGHSQGSGHALMLARDHEVARVIMLAGPPDRMASGQPSNAAVQWITEWRALSQTPASRLLGYTHEDDAIVFQREVSDSYDALGVGAATCGFVDAPAPGCRRVVGAAVGCRSFDAHITPAQRQFGNAKDACQLTGDRHDNSVIWAYLLTTPL